MIEEIHLIGLLLRVSLITDWNRIRTGMEWNDAEYRNNGVSTRFL